MADKSGDAGFYIQDDWKVTQRLTINMGLRYEWSSPFTERFNRLVVVDYAADSGVYVPRAPGCAPEPAPCDWTGKEIMGISRLAGPGHRTANVDKNNFGPTPGICLSAG